MGNTNRRVVGWAKWGAAASLAVALSVLVLAPATAEAMGHVRRVSRRTARRTTRRVVRRRLVVLPAAYRTVIYAGITCYVVEGVYYQAVKDEGNIVYVEVEK